jgi:beta-galactosidase
VSSLLSGSKVVSKVALLNSYDSRWSVQWQRHHRDFDYVGHFDHYYRPLAARNIPADIISAGASLDGYRLVIAPALLILNENVAGQLRDFVERGGHLVLTLRCGMKDEYNALLPSRQPGLLSDLAGVEVEEYYALLEEVPVIGNWFTGVSRLWAERLKVRDKDNTHAIARYGPSNGWLDDQLAITVHSYGRGLVYFVGAYLDEDAQQALIDRIVRMAIVKPVMETPTGVEACARVNPEGVKVFIVVNHGREEQLVRLPWPANEHLSGQLAVDELTLAPYEVALVTRST